MSFPKGQRKYNRTKTKNGCSLRGEVKVFESLENASKWSAGKCKSSITKCQEWELNNSKEIGNNEDYEIIDKGIVELEQETIEWQKILAELESKLSNLQSQEQQTQTVQSTNSSI